MSELCRVCFNTCDKTARKIDEIIVEIINILLLELNLDVIKEPVLCSDCANVLQKCFDFKSICFYIEEFIYPFMNAQSYSGAKLDLRQLFMTKQNLSSLEIPSSQRICRFCMELVTDESFIPLYNVDKNMLHKCVPELNLTVTKDPVICDTCYESLKDYSDLVNNCIQTEGQIRKYQQTKGVRKKGRIAITEVLWFIQEGSQADLNIRTEPEKTKHVIVEKSDYKECQFKPDDLENRKIERRGKRKRPHKRHKIAQNNISKVKTYSCEYCPYKAVRISNLNSHMRKHETTCKYLCAMCPFKSKYLESFRRHLSSHKDPSEQDFLQCAECEYKTLTKCQLNIHMMREHTDPSMVVKYRCENCEFSTFYKGDLKKHSLKHNDLSKVTVYKCETCEYQSLFRKALRLHEVKHKDSSQVTMHKCDLCPYKTKRKGDLRSHKVKHMNYSKIESFQCEICGHTFKTKSNLRKHVVNHQLSRRKCNKDSSELLFLYCAHCNFRTLKKQQLAVHMSKIHTNPSKMVEYNCERCEFSTVFKSKFNRHILVHKQL